MSTEAIAGELLFFDENTWLRPRFLKSIDDIFHVEGKVLNLELPKRQYQGLSDRQVLTILLTEYAPKNRVWVFTRDKTMYRHVPEGSKNSVVTIYDFTLLERYADKIRTCLLVIIILPYENYRAKRLAKKITVIVTQYIEDVLYVLDYYAEGFS